MKNERNQTQIKTDQQSLVSLLSNSATMHHANEVTVVVLPVSNSMTTHSGVQARLNTLTSALDESILLHALTALLQEKQFPVITAYEAE